MNDSMDVFVIAEIMRALMLYLAAPIVVLGGLLLTFRLRAPQFRRLGVAFRALKSGGDGEGMLPQGLTTSLASAGQLGAAAAVGTATAVALGGPGVLPYLWLFFLLVAPLRYAEAWLAGTDAPGGGKREESLSLARRIGRVGDRWRLPSVLVTLTVLMGAIFYGGILQADGLARSVEPLLPNAGALLVLGAAGAGTLLALLGRSTAAIAGYLGLLGIGAVTAWSLWTIGSAPGPAFAALGASISAAFDGASRFEAFGGAFAGEVAFAAMLHIFPAFAAPIGADGAAQSMSKETVRKQAASALLPPLAMAVLGTLLCMGLIGSGAYGQPVEATVPLLEGRIYKVPANTSAERLEENRWFSGHIRVRGGEARNPSISYSTGRGAIEDAVVLYNGRAADLALHVRDGVPFRILRNTSGTTLGEIAPTNLHRVMVQGEMAPRGGALLAAAAQSSGGDLSARLLLAALLALTVAAFAFWAFVIGRTLPTRIPKAARLAAGTLPLGAAAWALLAPPLGLTVLAQMLVAISIAVATLMILLRTREVSALER